MSPADHALMTKHWTRSLVRPMLITSWPVEAYS